MIAVRMSTIDGEQETMSLGVIGKHEHLAPSTVIDADTKDQKDIESDMGVEENVGDGARPTAAPSRQDSDSGDDEEESDADADDVVLAGYGSRGIVLERHIPADQIESQVASLHAMWEMAAVLDFFYLFRKQLKLQRQFRAAELERVIVASPGDGGLLADVHIVSRRGIKRTGLYVHHFPLLLLLLTNFHFWSTTGHYARNFAEERNHHRKLAGPSSQ